MVLKSWVEMMKLAKVRAVIHKTSNGYYLSAEDGKHVTLVTNPKGATRHWAKLDTLINQCFQPAGNVLMNMSGSSGRVSGQGLHKGLSLKEVDHGK